LSGRDGAGDDHDERAHHAPNVASARARERVGESEGQSPSDKTRTPA
jgi:hypothetical protein